MMSFFALKELARTIGEDNLYELFFVRRGRYAAAILVFTSWGDRDVVLNSLLSCPYRFSYGGPTRLLVFYGYKRCN